MAIFFETGGRVGSLLLSRSTRERTKVRAIHAAEIFLGLGEESGQTLETFTRDFFVWDRCLWCRKQLAKGRRLSKYQAANHRSHLLNHILPAFGDRLLSSLPRGEIENWLVSLPLSNQTKNHVLYTMRIIFREAEAQCLVSFSPVERIEPMGKATKKRDVFTLDEIHRLFPDDRDQLLAIWGDLKTATCFTILALTGIRSGEVRALQWQHWLGPQHLLIDQACKTDETVGQTKTGAVHLASLPRRAVETLALWRQESLYTADRDFIFFGHRPEVPMNRNALCRPLRTALRNAGISSEGRVLVVHSFRHTFVTLARKVVGPDVLRELTGHKTEAMAEHYNHPSLEDRMQKIRGVRPLLERIWSNEQEI